MDQETLARIGRPLMNCSRCGVALAQRAGKHPTVFVQGPLPVSPDAPPATPPAPAPSRDPDQVHRLDLCADCWPLEKERIQDLAAEDADGAATGPRIVGFWMTRRAAPKPKPARTRPSRPALLAWWDACWAGDARDALRTARTLDRPKETAEDGESSQSQDALPGIDPATRLRYIRTHLAALILMRHGALRWLATERPGESLQAPEILSFRRTATQTPVRVAAFLPGNDEELDALANEVDAHMQAWMENPDSVGPLIPEDAPAETASVADQPDADTPEEHPLPEATVA
jgi:hypothetical protein